MNKDSELSDELNKFFDEFAEKQKPLGDDFEKVLNDNLWELYGS